MYRADPGVCEQARIQPWTDEALAVFLIMENLSIIQKPAAID
jgi:hypothetical protein